MYFYLATVGFEPTPTSTAAPSNTETTVIPSRPIYIYILRGTRYLSFLTYIKCIIFCFYLEYNHLVCLVMEVGYISFSFHLFKVKFRETLLSYVIYPFFISMHVYDQPEIV